MGVPVVLRLSDYFLLCPRFDFIYNKKPCEDCLKKGYFTCLKHRCVKNSLFASLIRVLSMKIHSLIRIYDDVEAFITPSEFLRNKLIANNFNEKKIYHIPTFTVSKLAESIKETGTYGLYFGRITEEKGVETIVRAYEKLPELKVKIMGDDTTDEAIKLKNYIKKNKIKNIEFVGFKTGEELEYIIKGAKFTIIPSIWYDNFPNTAIESFKFSKPVIASNIGSLPELVEDNINGYLFEAGNIDDICEKIKMLDKCKDIEQMGEASRYKLEKEFSPDMHYKVLMSVFNKVKGN